VGPLGAWTTSIAMKHPRNLSPQFRRQEWCACHFSVEDRNDVLSRAISNFFWNRNRNRSYSAFALLRRHH